MGTANEIHGTEPYRGDKYSAMDCRNEMGFSTSSLLHVHRAIESKERILPMSFSRSHSSEEALDGLLVRSMHINLGRTRAMAGALAITEACQSSVGH